MHGIKYHLKRFLLIVFLVIKSAQCWSQVNENWTIGIQGGMASYYGDLSRYDSDPLKKLSEESDRWLGLKVGKRLSPAFGLELTFGNLKLAGYNNYEKYAFSSTFNEVLLSVDVSVINLLLPYNDNRFDLYGKGGYGIFMYDSFEFEFDNTSEDSKPAVVEPETERTGTVFMAGFGTSYRVGNRLKFSLEFEGRVSSSDLLDGFKGTSDVNDFYSTLGIGVSYIIKFKESAKNFYQEGSHEYRRYKRKDRKNRYSFINSD